MELKWLIVMGSAKGSPSQNYTELTTVHGNSKLCYKLHYVY